jgi:pantoate--beta-alanine ligase
MVPTMGALHAGHLALVQAAKRGCDRVVVTLFVNPAQFAPSEDLASYPRDEESDRRMLEAQGVDVLFAPPAEEMYPGGFDTTIAVGGPSAGLETDFRPHFFKGVATVVAKLLLAGLPDRAYFGEKDFQQLLVVKQLVRDLNIPTEIVGCPTVREPDGLALSSRKPISAQAGEGAAPSCYAPGCRGAHQESEPISGARLRREVPRRRGLRSRLSRARNAGTLSPVSDAKRGIRLLVAASSARAAHRHIGSRAARDPPDRGGVPAEAGEGRREGC